MQSSRSLFAPRVEPEIEEHRDRARRHRSGHVLVAVQAAPGAGEARFEIVGLVDRVVDQRDGHQIGDDDEADRVAPQRDGARRAQRVDRQQYRAHEDRRQGGAARHDAGLARPQRGGEAPNEQQRDQRRHGVDRRDAVLAQGTVEDHAKVPVNTTWRSRSPLRRGRVAPRNGRGGARVERRQADDDQQQDENESRFGHARVEARARRGESRRESLSRHGSRNTRCIAVRSSRRTCRRRDRGGAGRPRGDSR